MGHVVMKPMVYSTEVCYGIVHPVAFPVGYAARYATECSLGTHGVAHGSFRVGCPIGRPVVHHWTALGAGLSRTGLGLVHGGTCVGCPMADHGGGIP